MPTPGPSGRPNAANWGQIRIPAGVNTLFSRGAKTSLIMVFFGGAKIRYKTPGPAKFRSPKAAFRGRIRPSAGENKLFWSGTNASMKTVFWWKLEKGVFLDVFAGKHSKNHRKMTTEREKGGGVPFTAALRSRVFKYEVAPERVFGGQIGHLAGKKAAIFIVIFNTQEYGERWPVCRKPDPASNPPEKGPNAPI